MAYKQSPIGKRKCPYSPMQKRGLINESPVMMNGNTVSSSGGKSIDVDRKVGGNVNYMIRDGYQPAGEYVNDKGTRIVKYIPSSSKSKASPRYMQFNNKMDGKGKLHYDLTQSQYVNLLSRGHKGSGFKPIENVEERDMSGGLNQSMTEQVTTGKMAGNYEEEV